MISINDTEVYFKFAWIILHSYLEKSLGIPIHIKQLLNMFFFVKIVVIVAILQLNSSSKL